MKSAILSAACTLALAASALAQQAGQTVYKPGEAGVAAPRLIKEVRAPYTAQAIRLRAQGVIVLTCVVQMDGRVGDMRVVKGLEASLDEAAVKALEQWQFQPGTRDGEPVPVQVEVEMTFTLRDRGPRLGSPELVTIADGVVAPRLIRETKPTYPEAAKDAGIEGVVMMDCVVLTDGSVGDTRVTRSLHPMLDAEAIRAVHLWQFAPATKDGRPVPVKVEIEMTFTRR
jgi:TonB family protein